MVKILFNKNLIMSPKEDERFQLSNTSSICNKLFDVADNKVRDHCHVSGRDRGAAFWSCNVNFTMTKKIPVIFYNLDGYDSHLIFQELSKFIVQVHVIFIGSEKYMGFMINRDLVLLIKCNISSQALIY